MRKRPFVTVLMSVYGEHEDWLRKAIDSILSQTYQSFEFIIILDNPDNELLWAVLNDYRLVDNRIKLIRNEQNMGLAASLNTGLEISSGNYIVRMDADDISIPERIEVLVEFMEQNLEIGVCSSWMKAFGGSFMHNCVVRYPTTHDELEITSLYITPIAHAPAIIRRNIIEKFSPLYNIKCRRSQDYELWSRLMQNEIRFATIPKVLYLRRSSSNMGPQPIPYQIIHNQISRNNIQQILNDYSLKVPRVIENENIKELSNVFSKAFESKHKRLLSVILFLYYMSFSKPTLKRIRLLLLNGDLFILRYLPYKLVIRLFSPKTSTSYSINDTCDDESMRIF